MSKTEAAINQPVETAKASVGVSDVIGEFASSAWRAGVARPIQGVAQLAGVEVKLEPERNLTGAMRVAEVAGSSVGTLADILLLSKVVGRGVGAVAEAHQIKPLMTDGLAKSLTVSGTTGFVDGFAFTPTQPGEGITNRLAHGVAEGAGFMALDGASRYLGGLTEKALTNGISRTATRIGESVPTWASDGGRAAINALPSWATNSGRSGADFLMRNAQKGGELLTSRFPHLEAENALRNAIAGATGGSAYYVADATLNGKTPSLTDFGGTNLGWAAANVVFGGKLGPGRSAEVKGEAPPKPELPPEKLVETPVKFEPPPPPTYTPTTKVLENGSQQWSYKDVPGRGDEVTYTREKVGDYLSPKLDWQIKTADGKVYDASTKGPWEIKYPDGASLQMNEWNYLSFNKPISIKLGGKDVQVNEVTQLHPDQKPIAKQWMYQDPAVENQIVTFDAKRNWSAVDANGKSFGPASEGPWKVTNIDGYVESKAAGAGAEINVEIVPGLSNWRDRVKSTEPEADAGKPRRPRAFMLSTTDPSPMGLSELPRTMDFGSSSF